MLSLVGVHANATILFKSRPLIPQTDTRGSANAHSMENDHHGSTQATAAIGTLCIYVRAKPEQQMKAEKMKKDQVSKGLGHCLHRTQPGKGFYRELKESERS